MAYLRMGSRLGFKNQLRLRKRTLTFSTVSLLALVLSGCVTNMEAYNEAVIESVVAKNKNFLATGMQSSVCRNLTMPHTKGSYLLERLS